MEGIKRKRPQEGQVSDDEVEDPGIPEDQAPAEESEDEAEYYRQAVGEEPDQGIMSYQIIGEVLPLQFALVLICSLTP